MTRHVSDVSVGTIVRLPYQDDQYKVLLVNACRARVRPLKTRRVTIHDKSGNVRTFHAPRPAMDISPSTLVELPE